MRVKTSGRMRFSATGKTTLWKWHPLQDPSGLAFIDFTNAQTLTLGSGGGIARAENRISPLTGNLTQSTESAQPGYDASTGEAIFGASGFSMMDFSSLYNSVRTMIVVSKEDVGGSPIYGTLVSSINNPQPWHRNDDGSVLDEIHFSTYAAVRNGTHWLDGNPADLITTPWPTVDSVITIRVEDGSVAEAMRVGVDRGLTDRYFKGRCKALYLSDRYYTDAEIGVVNNYFKERYL